MISRKQNTDSGIALTLALLLTSSIWHIHVLYIVSIVSLFITAQFPVIYTPASRLWLQFARIMEVFFTAIILIIVFFFVVTPMGLFHRWFAKDNMQIRCFKKSKKSAFVVKYRTYKKEDLENQF